MNAILILIFIQIASVNIKACDQFESGFVGQVYRVIKLPQMQKCLVQINFSQIDSNSLCSIKLDEVQKEYLQIEGHRCDFKMDQNISGVIRNDGKKIVIATKS